MSPDPHQTFFEQSDGEIRIRLEAIAECVSQQVPGCEPCVSYKMPAFRLKKVFFYFAAFKGHIGIYPPVIGPEELVARLEQWRGPKGNLTFPHDEALRLDLISEVANALAQQYGSKGEK